MYGLVPFRKRGGNLGRRSNWESFFDDFFSDDGFFPAFFPTRNSMRADIKETEKEFIVEAEVPGVRKEDIKLDLYDNTLTISVEHNEEKKEDGDNYLRRERRYGSISRTFYVDNINHEDVKAEYKDGILKVTLPKVEETKAKRRQIDIH